MTDLPEQIHAVPNRLGVGARVDDEGLVLRLTPTDLTSVHGVVRTSVLAYVVDAVAGVGVDSDPDRWTFTSDLSVHRAVDGGDGLPAEVPWVDGRSEVLRASDRSATARVSLIGPDGPVGVGTAGFVRVPRREDDPPKPSFDPRTGPSVWNRAGHLDAPLREAAAIEVLDAAAGVTQVEVRPELCNPAGTLQGAMVALLAEVAAEELATHAYRCPAVVTDLEVRYLAQARDGEVRATCTPTGGPRSPIVVELRHVGTGRLVTHVVARAVPVTAR